jgi:hypothetical protein
VRRRAAEDLGKLMALKPRVDPLIADITTNLRTQEPVMRPQLLMGLVRTHPPSLSLFSPLSFSP